MWSVSVHTLQSRLALVVIVLGLGAVGLIWAKVALTITDARPVSSPASQPVAIVWADRVFQTHAALRRWLSSRGASYGDWMRRHPAVNALAERPPTHAAKAKPPPANRAPATAGRFSARDVSLAILALLAVVCAGAVALPAAVLDRFPGVARSVVPHRDLLLAGAVALVVGLVIGIALS